MLSLTGIGKRFGAVQVLTDVHLDVAPGEVVALVGDNGAGKSTLVKIMAGVYQPDGGEITFAGRKVTVGGPSEAQTLGHRDGLPGPRAVRQPGRGGEPLPGS